MVMTEINRRVALKAALLPPVATAAQMPGTTKAHRLDRHRQRLAR